MPAPATVLDALDRAAGTWPERVAWRFDPGRTLTFAAVAREVEHLAAALAAVGVGEGDRVAVLLPNRAEHPLTWLALMRLGATSVPLNVRYRDADAAHVLALGAATAVVTDADHRALPDRLGSLVLDVDDLLASDARPAAPRTAAQSDVVNVQTTSGTTGRPKGCLLTHRYWTVLATGLCEEFPHLGSGDVMLTAQPFSYLDPQWNVVSALVAGAELVVLDGFHPSSFWAKVREHRVTYFYCLAAMPVLLLRQPPSPDDEVHDVRVVQCSAIPPALHADIEQRWGVPWFEAFGMTETGADLRVTAEDHDVLVGTGCVGAATSYRRARVDATSGELQLHGAGMFDGYVDDPDATAAAFTADGWFRTGDLARLDDADRVYLTGRLKDMIRRGGENVAAREVEDVLLSHPAVRLVAVTGVPDEVRGEEVRAWVVADGVQARDLAEHCAAALASFKVPRFWSFHADLPRTPSERVEKRRLVELAAEVVDLAEVPR